MIFKAIKFIFLLILVAIVLAVIYSGYFIYRIYWPLAPRGEAVIFKIEEGSGVNAISRNLYRQELIKDKFVFETYVWLLKSEGKIKAGEYSIPKEISIKNLTSILISGKALNKEKDITIIEGWNLRDIDRMLLEEGIVGEGELFALAGKPAVVPAAVFDFSGEYDFLASKPKETNLEGYLYPDTYRVFKDASPKDIIRKALDNFSRKLTPELREEIKRQGKTIHEIVTLASIVEKEARGEKDGKMIADLFWRRLKAGMPLQADSTVNYITGGKKPSISREETQIDSPYNTYKYKGLPPGPIANPSIKSIKAVIYPIPNDYWYFLTTPDDGRAIYAKTNGEQNANKKKYLR